MSRIESEILLKVSHLDGEEKNAVLNYIRDLKGRNNSKKKHRRSAMRQIREALNGQS